MSKEDKQAQMIKALTKMFLVTGSNADEPKIMAYIEYLRDYATENNISFESVMEAIKKAGRAVEYTPKVSEIIKFLEPSKDEVSAELTQAANYEAQQALNDLMFLPHPRTSDPISKAVIAQIGFSMWKDRPLDETKGKFMGLFISNYKQIAQAEASGGSLALEEAKEKEEREKLYE